MLSSFVRTFKKAFNFKGRAQRMEYWFFSITCWAATGLLGIAASVLGGEHSLPAVISGIFTFITILPQIAVGVRRMHDTGRPGWWLVLPVFNVYFLLKSGDEGPNEYGEDPKAIDVMVGDGGDRLPE